MILFKNIIKSRLSFAPPNGNLFLHLDISSSVGSSFSDGQGRAVIQEVRATVALAQLVVHISLNEPRPIESFACGST